MTAIGDTEAAYVAAVLMHYADMPDTPIRPSLTDRSLARKLHQDAVPLPLVESALRLGTFDADNEHHDYYGVKGSPSPAVELIDLSMAADTEDTRAFLLEEGLSPERCASKRLVFRDRSCSVVGPLEVWPRRGGDVDFPPNAVFLKRILREVREMTPSVIDSAKVSKGDKTAADAARLFKIHPATVSRLLARSSRSKTAYVE